MKKNRINLLINRVDYQKYEGVFDRLKLLTAVLSLMLLIVFIFFFILLRKKADTYDTLSQQKATYLQFLTERVNDEAKINAIQKKYLDLKTFLKDDASSAPYYKLLSDALDVSSQSAVLTSFAVNKGREVSFTVSFVAFEKMMDFLKFAESPDFIKNFENISLNNFIIVGNKDKSQSYELSFSGKFAPIGNQIKNGQ